MRFTFANLAECLANYADPAYAVSGDGAIIAWNPAVERVLGFSREDVLGKPCHEVICGKDLFGNLVCQHECHVLRNIREGIPARRFRMHVRVSEGHHVEVDCATLSIKDSSKEIVILHLLRLWPDNAIDSVFHRHRGDVQAPRRSLTYLTHRQKEVLALLTLGKSTREMAEVLHVSQGTVRSHVENILYKLEAHSRLEAVIIAHREGLN